MVAKNILDQMSRKRRAYYSDEFKMPPECDLLCRFRTCYNKYENKGVYAPGLGYTNFTDDFEPACATRLNSGCPETRGEIGDNIKIPELIRWCIEILTKAKGTKSVERKNIAYKTLTELSEHPIAKYHSGRMNIHEKPLNLSTHRRLSRLPDDANDPPDT